VKLLDLGTLHDDSLQWMVWLCHLHLSPLLLSDLVLLHHTHNTFLSTVILLY
jgi:hypothetical protein